MKLSGASFAFGTVILAAGRSSRMGSPKMLLPWKGTTVLGHHLAVWKTLGSTQIAVVGASGNTAMIAEMKQLSFPLENLIVNPEPGRGMFSSVQCAAHWNGWKDGLTHFVIVLADQPHLSSQMLGGLIAHAEKYPDRICQPSRLGRPRHPVILPAWDFAALKKTRAANLKQFLESMKEKICFHEADDPDLDLDLDYPSDYEKLKSRMKD